jgi:hypothetical protein
LDQKVIIVGWVERSETQQKTPFFLIAVFYTATNPILFPKPNPKSTNSQQQHNPPHKDVSVLAVHAVALYKLYIGFHGRSFKLWHGLLCVAYWVVYGAYAIVGNTYQRAL